MSGAWHRPVIIREDESETELREKFARLRAQFPTLNDFEVASECFKGLPDAPARAGAAAMSWGRDAGILARVEDLRRVGWADDSDIAEDVLCREVLALARQQTGVEVKDRLKAYEIVAEIKGYSKKGQTNVNVAVVNRVMKVTDHGDDTAWEARVEAQQRGLMNVTPAPH